MKELVLGGTGVIGRVIVRQLLAEENEFAAKMKDLYLK
jgi:hypothetical protein